MNYAIAAVPIWPVKVVNLGTLHRHSSAVVLSSGCTYSFSGSHITVSGTHHHLYMEASQIDKRGYPPRGCLRCHGNCFFCLFHRDDGLFCYAACAVPRERHRQYAPLQ